MGTYDTLVDGERSVQVKVFDNEFNTYNIGDKIPCDGSFIIMFPEYEDSLFAIIKDSVFLGLTDCPPIIIDKWGNQLTSYDAFKSLYEDLVQSLESKVNES